MNTLSLVALIGIAAIAQPPTDPKEYVSAVEAWRSQQEKSLMGPKSWLACSGLYWLKEGENPAGSSADNAVVLPADAPAHLGSFVRTGSEIKFVAKSAGLATVGGRPVESTVLGDNTELTAGPLTIVKIVRGNRIGLRLYDSQSKALKEFQGLKWYPIDPKFRIAAKFTPFKTGKSYPIVNVLGDTQNWASPGYVTFQVDGKPCRLVALDEGDILFFNFHDKTSGKTTYPAGRFLYAPKPTGDTVVLDFNKATNPPCAFTNAATCPLPPSDNFLSVAISAGEKTHHPPE